MDTFWGLTQTAWTAITALLTGGLLVVAVVAALYAARQVSITRDQAEETRRAGLEASRPYVVVTIEASPASQQLFDLVVRNIGQRPAMAASITLDPPPVRAEEIPGHEMSKAKLLTQPIEMLAPQQELRAFYDMHVDRVGRDDLPSSHRVSMTYQDSSGNEYHETAVLDLEAMKGATYTEVKTLHDVGKSLAQIQATLKGASILNRRGALEVEASVERRSERQERLAERAAEVEAFHDRVDRQISGESGGEESTSVWARIASWIGGKSSRR